MRQAFRLFTLLVALLSCSILAGAQGSPVAGEWEINMNTPGGVRTFKALFNVDGEKLTGEVRRPTGNVPLKGTVRSGSIEFSYTISYQGNDVEITMAGKLDGDGAAGSVSFNGNPAEEWNGRRLAASAAPSTSSASGSPSAGASSSIDISGAWDFEVTTAQGSGQPTFTFKQNGESITGKYQGMLGDAPLTGRLSGNRIEFSFKVSGQIEGTISYTGTTDGKTMQGKVVLAGLGEGTFTGRRK
jgi:hypothetical protein